jgi:hypothetical protein
LGSAGFSAGGATNITLSVSTGNTFVAYSDQSTSPAGRAVAMQYSSSWGSLGSAAGFSTNAANSLSFVVATSTSLWAAYLDGSTGYPTVQNDAGSWTAVTGTPAATDQETSIAYDGVLGYAYLAYGDVGHSNQATVIENTGTNTWVTVGSAGFTSGSVQSLRMGAYNGVQYVAYQDGTNGNVPTVMSYSGGGWYVLGGAALSTDAINDIALDVNSGTPYVAFSDQSTSPAGKLTVEKWNGSSWVIVGSAGITPGAASYISLYVNSGTAYVSYSDGNNANFLSVQKYSAGTWQYLGPAGFSASNATFTSISLNGTTPYVAFSDGSASGKATVMVFQ